MDVSDYDMMNLLVLIKWRFDFLCYVCVATRWIILLLLVKQNVLTFTMNIYFFEWFLIFLIFSKERILRPLVNLDHLAAQLTDRNLCPIVVTFC